MSNTQYECPVHGRISAEDIETEEAPAGQVSHDPTEEVIPFTPTHRWCKKCGSPVELAE